MAFTVTMIAIVAIAAITIDVAAASFIAAIIAVKLLHTFVTHASDVGIDIAERHENPGDGDDLYDSLLALHSASLGIAVSVVTQRRPADPRKRSVFVKLG